jgi:hypothetical protein
MPALQPGKQNANSGLAAKLLAKLLRQARRERRPTSGAGFINRLRRE